MLSVCQNSICVHACAGVVRTLAHEKHENEQCFSITWTEIQNSGFISSVDVWHAQNGVWISMSGWKILLGEKLFIVVDGICACACVRTGMWLKMILHLQKEHFDRLNVAQGTFCVPHNKSRLKLAHFHITLSTDSIYTYTAPCTSNIVCTLHIAHWTNKCPPIISMTVIDSPSLLLWLYK